MNKAISFVIMTLALVLVVSAGVSAEISETSTYNTYIAGKIYNADYTETVSDASVIVTCDYEQVIETTSLSDGSYSVMYVATSCGEGSHLEVYAEKDGLYGNKEGDIHSLESTNWDFAVVNVPLVPEFGVLAGGLTILGAVGVFFFVRRK